MLRGLPAVGTALGFVLALASGIVLVTSTPSRAEIVFESRPPAPAAAARALAARSLPVPPFASWSAPSSTAWE